MKAILDASPIIAFFAEMREPEILFRTRALGYELLVPDAVYRKDITKEPSKAILEESVKDGSVSLLPPVEATNLEAFMRAHPSLGEGESEVILSASEFLAHRESVVCILDERPARRAAERLGLPVRGTLGVLRALEDSDLLGQEDVARLKRHLQAAGFRADASLLR